MTGVRPGCCPNAHRGVLHPGQRSFRAFFPLGNSPRRPRRSLGCEALRFAQGKLREVISTLYYQRDADCFGRLRLPRNDNHGTYAKVSYGSGQGEGNKENQCFCPAGVSSIPPHSSLFPMRQRIALSGSKGIPSRPPSVKLLAFSNDRIEQRSEAITLPVV